MDLGSIPAWGALLISAVAVVQSWRANRRAREARAGNDSLETSLQRIADTFVESHQRTEQDLLKRRTTEFSHSRFDERRRTAVPEFNLEFVRGHAYRIRNVGLGIATGVTVLRDKLPAVANRLPANVTLNPFESTETFILQGAMQAPLPGEISIVCNEVPEPVLLQIPAHR